MNKDYYKQVGEYYNHDSTQFESRYHENKILQKIRTEFRNITDAFPAQNILEIGYGPGLDLVYFATKNPNAKVYGLDISKGMFDAATANISGNHLSNVKIDVGSVEDIETAFPGVKFDLVYVFFGALNTVEDLDLAAKKIHESLTENGVAVLTFVNKWYLRGMVVPLLKGRFKIAFARIRKIWGGYSTKYFLPSKCYSIGDIKKVFNQFTIQKIKGYSIFYPAWYDGFKYNNESTLTKLWKMDERVNEAMGRGFGEYALFVLRKRS